MIDEKLNKIEELTKDIESEKNFDTVVKKFTEAAELIKVVLSETAQEKGRVMELVRGLDVIIEKELPTEN